MKLKLLILVGSFAMKVGAVTLENCELKALLSPAESKAFELLWRTPLAKRTYGTRTRGDNGGNYYSYPENRLFEAKGWPTDAEHFERAKKILSGASLKFTVHSALRINEANKDQFVGRVYVYVSRWVRSESKYDETPRWAQGPAGWTVRPGGWYRDPVGVDYTLRIARIRRVDINIHQVALFADDEPSNRRIDLSDPAWGSALANPNFLLIEND